MELLFCQMHNTLIVGDSFARFVHYFCLLTARVCMYVHMYIVHECECEYVCVYASCTVCETHG